MKKFMVLLLTLSLIVGSTGVAFANNSQSSSKSQGKNINNTKSSKEDTFKDFNKNKNNVKNMYKANVLYNLGLFNGINSSTFVPDLETASDRAQAITLIGRAMGWDISKYKNDSTLTSKFTDLQAYAAPYILYAYDHNITKGIGNDRFGSTLPVNSRMMYTWYARALSYTEDVYKDPKLLYNIGLMTQVQYDTLMNTNWSELDNDAIRDQIVSIMYDSMFWKTKGSNVRLIRNMYNHSWINRNYAEECGLLDEPTEKIVSWNATLMSVKAIKLDFTQILNPDSVDELNNSQIAIKIDDVVLPTNKYSLEVAGKSIYVTLTDSLIPQTVVNTTGVFNDKLEITVSNTITSNQGIPVETATKQLQVVSDTQIPTVLSVKALTASKLEITFSEPIETIISENTGDVLINGSNSLVKGVYLFPNARTVLTITLDTPLLDGTYTVTLLGNLKDYAGNSIIQTTKNISIDEDHIAPKISSVTVLDRTHLTIHFNEPIKDDHGLLMMNDVTFDKDHWNLKASTMDVELMLDETTALSSTSDTDYVFLSYKDFEDVNGTKDTNWTTFKFKATEDIVKPTANATVNSVTGNIEIVFSEPIDGFTLADYKVTAVIDPLVSIVPTLLNATLLSYNTETHTAVLSIVAGQLLVGDTVCTLTLLNTTTEKITDMSVNQNALDQATFDLTITIAAAPTV